MSTYLMPGAAISAGGSASLLSVRSGVGGCVAPPFLQQFDGFRWDSARFLSALRVTLFDRAAGFRVQRPVIDARPAGIANR